jgi:hypothetical protein
MEIHFKTTSISDVPSEERWEPPWNGRRLRRKPIKCDNGALRYVKRAGIVA